MKTSIIALLVASIWGLNPIFEKLGLRGTTPFAMITIRFLFTTLCLLSITFARGKTDELLMVDKTSLFWIILSGLVGGLIGLYLFFVALKADEASKVVPIVASFPMFTAFYSYLFLKENITALRLVGIIFIVVGLTLINWKDIISN